MSRMFWFGRVGYPDEATRDQVHTDFAAAVQPLVDDGTITPATWEALPDIPAGLDTIEDVDGLPGVTIGYDVPRGWDNTEAYVQLYSILQDPAESGYQGMSTKL